MSVLPFKKKIPDWNDEERLVFKEIVDVRHSFGRICSYMMARSEEGDPICSFYLEPSGHQQFNVSRGKNGTGYLIYGPERETAYVGSLKELREGFVFYNPEKAPTVFRAKK